MDKYIEDAVRFTSETNKSTFEIVMNPNTNKHGANALDFEKILSGIRSLFSGIGNSANLFMVPSLGSLVLRFYTDEETTLFNQYQTDTNIKKIVTMVSSDKDEVIREIIKANPKIIPGLRKFTESISRLESPIRVIASSPDNSYFVNKVVTRNQVQRIDQVMENLDIEVQEPFAYIGETHAIDIDNKTIKFINEDDKLIKGKYEILEERNYKVISKYKFSGFKTYKLDKTGKEISPKFVITSIVDL
ncbi:MAG: hypothetical protein UMR38_06370 [Candidatus Izemoplasma sp.]|nr:hypothetical protein [Candidatus Izemoplasma sp.]